MRMGCSALRHQLHEMRIIENATCDCGYKKEDPEHFLLHCVNYNHIRPALLQNNIHPSLKLNTRTLLYGDPKVSVNHNKLLFERVIKYILASNRFQSKLNTKSDITVVLILGTIVNVGHKLYRKLYIFDDMRMPMLIEYSNFLYHI